MESFSGDNEEQSTEDVTKRKSSKIKSLKSRFFRRAKKKGVEADANLSQSASDITAGKGLGSDEDLASQGTMGSRAFSHESIFLDDQVLSDPDPVRVSSQENVHSKIKSLQMKLQLQKMHFGPPPMVLPIKSPEETAQLSEDFTFQGSNENSGEGTLTESTSQPTSPPVSPISKLAQTRSPSQMPSHHFSVSGPNYSSPAAAEDPVDFSTPAEFTASLDTSALRHRMSIKPRNQRASSKRKPPSGIESGSPLRDLRVRDRFEHVREQEKEAVAQEGETMETDKGQANLSQLSPLTFEELSPVSSEVASKLTNQAFPILRVKPSGQLDAWPTKRPHSSYLASEIKEKKESDLESQLTSQNKRNTFFASMTEVSSEQLSPFSSWLTSRSPLGQQQQPKNDEDISTRIKRQSSGSDSFHLSGNRDEERPRSGSFTGLLEKSKPRTKSFGVAEEKIAKEREEQKGLTGSLEKPEARSRSFEGIEEKTREFGGTEEKKTRQREELKNFTGVLEKPEAKTRPFGGTEEKITREREEVKSLQPKGSPFAADRSKGSSLPWERNLNYKKTEPVTADKNSPLNTYVVEAARVDGTSETVDEAVEAKELPEDETRTPFGVKLRSTSRSFKFRSETASQPHSATLLSDDQDVNTKKRQKMVDCSSEISEKTLANTSSSSRPPDPAPVRRNASLEENSQTTPAEVQTTSIHLRESETGPQVTQPSPQASSSDVSWMSLAMEKTRSLQHLLTSRFQRDFTGTQTGARPKSQEETITGPQVQNQTVKLQQSTPQQSSDKMKEESVQSSDQEQAVKPSAPASQKKMTLITQFESCNSRDSPISRQMTQGQTQPNKAQSDAQAITKTTHSPSPSSPLIGNTSPFTFTRKNAPQLLAQPYQSSPQQQTCGTSQGLQPATQLKHVPSALDSEPAVTSAAAPTLDFALERREKESSVLKESPSLVSKRVLWTGSAADRAAFMEKRAEWTTPPLLKEVEQKKSQAQMQTSSDTDTLAYLFPLSKDTMEIRQVAKSAESSPCRVIEKPPEDKWTQKNVELPSSLSSLRTRSSALHSDSSQPSWMELAKRKSMAWSDKSTG
ncbi:hypothetical protein CCH79_00002597 [Gambusia affinis]|uniref:DUF4592 domain-containing protein n=1 Tax=Gambusia affinis TaxID=33528 RepID=A0A315W6Q0_GAMAF|nr:hypothetical protein CCH79_00002597 [Gambusia affinis]